MLFFFPRAEKKNRLQQRIKVSRHVNTYIEEEGEGECVSVCVRARLGKNAKKNLHLRQPSSILSLTAAEDESRCTKLD